MIEGLAKYVYEVYRCKSVTVAAKNLYISQPSLSAAIKKVEEKLGEKIFDRSTTPFTLTPEGRIYIDTIEKMIQLEEDAKQQIQDISDFKKGLLRIGTSSYASYFLIPSMCEIFHKRYPGIQIRISVLNQEQLQKSLEKRELDVVFSYDTQPTVAHREFLCKEKLVVIAHKDLIQDPALHPYMLTWEALFSGNYTPEQEVPDIGLFHDLKFIYYSPNSAMYRISRLLAKDQTTIPYIVSESNQFLLNYNLMQAGLCAMLISDHSLAVHPPNENCFCFVLQHPSAQRNFCIDYVQNTNSIPGRIAEEFAAIAKEQMQKSPHAVMSTH